MRDSKARLALLRRLRGHHSSGYLGTLTESTAEQSWNEQLFAGVLGYQTLLSHDRLPFHLRPKTYNTHGKYDDFSLGFFGIAGEEVVLGSAELKGAGADLDAPQKGKSYKNKTPVQQALETARKVPTCRWVIVSNLTELRLYPVDDDEPVAVVLLHEITSARDLARLCALFDRRALLGDHGDDAEMVNAPNKKETHPSMPLAKEEGCYRVIFRFTPSEEQRFPLFEVEEALRAMTRKDGDDLWLRPSNRDPDDDFPAALQDGWVAFETSVGAHARRIAMSTLGEIQVTSRLPFQNGDTVTPLSGIGDALKLGIHVVRKGYYGVATRPTKANGLVTVELRDVKEKRLYVEGTTLLRTDSNMGVAEHDVITAGDFKWGSELGSSTRICSHSLCELAIQFRSDTGGVAFDPVKLNQQVFADMGELANVKL